MGALPSVGRVAQLWRYPVKSMLGERLEQTPIDARGVHGDRAFAVCDRHGKLGSGKDTRRFRRLDGLFGFHARWRGDRVRVDFPDGRSLEAGDPALDASLSDALGDDLRLAAEGDVRHFDAGPVHLLTTSALQRLQSLLPDLHIDARRFRPNLVIDDAGVDLPDSEWIGRTLCVGDQVLLRVSEATERCRMTTLAQDELPEEPRILRGLARHADLHVGVYAEVVRGGTVACGAPVRLLP